VLNPSKSQFMMRKLSIFGYDVDETGLRPCPARVEKLLALEISQTWKALRSAIASIAYFRPSIPQFAHVAKKIFEWSTEKSPYDPKSEEAVDAWKKLMKCLAKTYFW
jgi:hypothetical protein